MSNAPTLEQFLQGATRWRSKYKEINIELSFHDWREPDGFDPYPHGTWCYYLILNEEMFEPEDWNKLRFYPYICDSGYETYDYYKFPDVVFHGGVTFYELTKVYMKHVRRYVEIVKVGCDYNHLWDSEGGYADTYETVLMDAKRTVRKLLEQFPNINMRCGYSGIWDKPEMFYAAQNGQNVHKSMEEKLTKDNYWVNWLPIGSGQ